MSTTKLDSSQQKFNVKAYGAIGRAATDSTNDSPAIQATITAVKANYPQGGIVDIPPGDYHVSSIDMTDCERLTLRGLGATGGVRLYADKQLTPAAVIIGESANGCTIKNISVNGQQVDGNPPAVIPTRGIHLGNLDKFTMRNVSSEGYFSTGALVLDGSTNCNFYNCPLQIRQVGGSPLVFLGTPYCNENRFFGCEFHARFADLTGTAPSIWAQGVTNFASFHGCLIDVSGPTCSFLKIDAAARDWLFESCKFYSEGGGNPNYVLSVAAGIAATGIGFEGSGYIPNVTPNLTFLDMGAGATVPGLRIRGWSPRNTIKGAGISSAVEQWLHFAAMANVAAGATKYIGMGFADTSVNNTRLRLRRKGILVGMRADAGGSPGGVETYIFAVQVETGDVYTCTVTGAAVTAQNADAVAEIDADESVNIRATASAAASTLAAANVSVGVIWAEDGA